MRRPRLLDLFCGAGGCTKGYQRSGFAWVVGVDNRPQPNYCGDDFILGDALEVLARLLAGEGVTAESGRVYFLDDFDAIHASPPCQVYVRSGMVAKDGRHPDLLGSTRDLLVEAGRAWVIENVPGAPMRPDIILCGSMFALNVRRHRWFETSIGEPVLTLACDHSRAIAGVYGHPHGKGGPWRNGQRPMLDSDLATWSEAMGIDWMLPPELAQAIPPAYTELIGHQLLSHLKAQAVA